MSRSIESLNMKEKADLVQEVLDKKSGLLIDKDWCDIVVDYDLDCNPETLRKAGVGVKLAGDAGMCFPKNPSGTSGVMDGYVERQKLYDLQRNIRKDLREQSRSELIRETIREAIRDLPKFEIHEMCDSGYREAERDLVVGIGDFHYGARFTVTGLYGEEINRYDPEVFEQRMNQLLYEIKAIALSQYADRITVVIVGDLLEGLLRASQLTRLEYGVVESAIRLSEYLCTWLYELQHKTGLPVRVYGVRGNHGEIRPLGSKAGQFPEENMERVVMHYLYERFFENPMITVGDNDAPMVRMVDVVGYKVLLIHGQGNDIENITRDHQNLYYNKIDMVICGHLHKSQTFTAGVNPGGNALIERVPSICGVDPFAQSKGYGSPPGATAIVMEKGYGRRCVYPIVLK